MKIQNIFFKKFSTIFEFCSAARHPPKMENQQEPPKQTRLSATTLHYSCCALDFSPSRCVFNNDHHAPASRIHATIACTNIDFADATTNLRFDPLCWCGRRGGCGRVYGNQQRLGPIPPLNPTGKDPGQLGCSSRQSVAARIRPRSICPLLQRLQ